MQPGWNYEKVQAFRESFFDFLKYVTVNSKENGQIVLGDHVYRAQMRLLDGIFDGLTKDIHDFKVLKSRQLGISTISRALTLFWIGIHPGLKGYMVFDTDGHKEEARLEILGMLEMLPSGLGFPGKKRGNRYLLELENGSTLTFASAGVKSSKSSGVLGRSSGINLVHASEMCSWDNIEGLESFKNALAEEFPNRLFIWESTARGYNQWEEMWREARADPSHQSCIFIGWWAKDNQQIDRNHPDFARYGASPPTEDEAKMIQSVRELYNWVITPEQLAWYRRKMDPSAVADGDAPVEFKGDTYKLQEQPSTETEAFQMTGATFFEPERLTEIAHKDTSRKFKAYSYGVGIDFVDCRIYPAPNARSIQLKVWEEPEDQGVYVVSADPAFGINERNDRSGLQVLRCYADGVDQVAEYAWPLVNTRQFAWVIASLLAWYAGDQGEAFLILELNGPGSAVWDEIKSLKHQIQHSYRKDELEERGLTRIFNNVRNYVYARSDALIGGASSYHWITNARLKVAIMERLRDFVSNGGLRIRSIDTLEEMKSITRDGDSIEAQGSKKDDRVMAMALGIRCWEDKVRRTLIARKMTRENVEHRKRLTLRDQVNMYNDAQLQNFFARKSAARRRLDIAASRARWRGR